MTQTILSGISVIGIYLEFGAWDLVLIFLGRGFYEKRRTRFFEGMGDASSFPVSTAHDHPGFFGNSDCFL
jgi:hypothetical protein